LKGMVSGVSVVLILASVKTLLFGI
jgi:hypothetical protein